jgi:hypothetical protein
MTKKSKREVAKEYEPTPRERAAIDANFAKAREKPPAPALKVERKGNARNISTDHADVALGSRLLMEAVGTTDPNFLHGLLCQLTFASEKKGEVSEDAVNFLLSVVKGIEPKDQVEASLLGKCRIRWQLDILKEGLQLSEASPPDKRSSIHQNSSYLPRN